MPVLNIVVPMAGRGSRFVTAGYKLPKPLLPIHGVPMISVVVENLRPTRAHRFIFICQQEHVQDYDVAVKLRRIAPGSEVIAIDGITEGAACSVLKAEALIDSDDPLMIANSDQYVDMQIDSYLAYGDRPDTDGLIMTMNDSDPKWSYAKISEEGNILDVVEKRVVSNDATVGIYNFAHGKNFVAGAHAMIEANLRVNNEFYVAPVYNQLIARGQKIKPFSIGAAGDRMFGLGIPEDLEFFLKQPISQRAVTAIGV